MPKPTKPIKDLDRLRYLASIGLSEKKIATSLGMCWYTFNERRKDQPGVLEAFDEGRALGVEKVSSALYNNAMDGSFSAQKFFLTNRAPDQWSDKSEVLTVGDPNRPTETAHTVEFITPPEVENKYESE